ncbi:anti-sigma factor [Actinomadura sp. NBRC 104425]|uniref:anti-sigma factor family protein n=1 Tax=Actinomadura sp. NBRC 104425 TaxID=3032204 RepID=UPI0024A023BF|nr:zf-HC2 domain-containing protein [Actinomadura sp. NBRC 104425]GLZ14663.1 anti-sigma factor [Actinomadura sp. NBRC 104425]
MNECAQVRTALGVYVVGAIDAAERSRLEQHLDACPACRDELAGLAGLPALLGRVDEAQIRQVAEPPPELLDSLLARAAEQKRSRRFGGGVGRLRWAPLAAACVLFLMGVLFGGLVRPFGDGGRPAATRTVTADPQPQVAPAERLDASDPRTRIDAYVMLYKKQWGTKVELYLSGAPRGEHCKWYAVARDGQRDPLGSWYVPYSKGYGRYDGSTMFQRDQIFSFEIMTVQGRPLLTVRG